MNASRQMSPNVTWGQSGPKSVTYCHLVSHLLITEWFAQTLQLFSIFLATLSAIYHFWFDETF